MPPTEHDYREMQKMNERLRRENHLLQLLHDLHRETPWSKGEALSGSGCGSDLQDKEEGKGAEMEAQVMKELSEKPSWNGSEDTLRGVEDDGKGEDMAGVESLSEQNDKKEGGEKVQDTDDMNIHEDTKMSEDENKQPEENKEEEKEEEEENSQYEDSDASDFQSEATWSSNRHLREESESDPMCSEEESDGEIGDEDYETVHTDRISQFSHRNGILSWYKKAKFGIETVADTQYEIDARCHSKYSNYNPQNVGHSKLDAGLYMANGLGLKPRTDVWVYISLYGLHPGIVACIGESLSIHIIHSVCSLLIMSDTPGYQPTLTLLDRHAEVVLSRDHTPTSDFFDRFHSFLKVLEEAKYPSGYFNDDIKAPEAEYPPGYFDDYDVHPTERHPERYRVVADAYMACVDTLNSARE